MKLEKTNYKGGGAEMTELISVVAAGGVALGSCALRHILKTRM